MLASVSLGLEISWTGKALLELSPFSHTRELMSVTKPNIIKEATLGLILILYRCYIHDFEVFKM